MGEGDEIDWERDYYFSVERRNPIKLLLGREAFITFPFINLSLTAGEANFIEFLGNLISNCV